MCVSATEPQGCALGWKNEPFRLKNQMHFRPERPFLSAQGAALGFKGAALGFKGAALGFLGNALGIGKTKCISGLKGRFWESLGIIGNPRVKNCHCP
jgi:hypothetical protein